MLHNFLLTYRTEILALCTAKLLSVSDSKITSNEMDQGLPVFYDELIEVLRADENDAEVITNQVADRLHHGSAMKRGKESFKLGYTISQVVHGYGALCQSITEFAANHSEQIIVAREFNRLNFCLDVAIAEAVTEFSKGQSEQFAQAEVQRLGFLAHEMRNALNNMATAYHMIKEGLVGFAGSTSQILENALGRMSDIIDRSLSEVRLRGEPAVDLHRSRVVDMIGEVEATAVFNAAAKSIKLHVEVEPDLIVSVDHHLMVSALSNLVQNAIKFTLSSKCNSISIPGMKTIDQVRQNIQSISIPDFDEITINKIQSIYKENSCIPT